MQSSQTLPKEFIGRLNQIILPADLPKVLESFYTKKPSTFRVNTLKISASELKNELKKISIEVEDIPWYKDAFILKNVPQKILTETKWYTQGFLYVQSLSSMIPPLILNPQKNEKILDLTAAPGSKTTQIAALMENTEEIVANDKSKIRLYKLSANLKIQGITNTTITHMPGQILWKKYPEYFDKTLLDSPCSLEGMFFSDNPKTYKDWSLAKIKFLANMQKFLLRSAISATKVGGEIIYSTCTLSPEENEGVIDWILKKEKDAIEIEPVTIPLPHHMPGITSWNGKVFDKRVSQTVRILPSSTMEAFFVAKIKKIKSTISPASFGL